MLLIPISNLSIEEQRNVGSCVFKKDFTAGWRMSDFMMDLDRQVGKLTAEGVIYWHSNHLQIMLWTKPETEKYLTLMLIKGA